MRVYNSYILNLTLIFTVITIALAAIGQDSLDVYFTAYTLSLLALTLFYAFLNPPARRALSMVSFAALGGFLIVLALKLIEMRFWEKWH